MCEWLEDADDDLSFPVSSTLFLPARSSAIVRELETRNEQQQLMDVVEHVDAVVLPDPESPESPGTFDLALADVSGIHSWAVNPRVTERLNLNQEDGSLMALAARYASELNPPPFMSNPSSQ
jgi:hypothetical protein